jgi:hypothetical protein
MKNHTLHKICFEEEGKCTYCLFSEVTSTITSIPNAVLTACFSYFSHGVVRSMTPITELVKVIVIIKRAVKGMFYDFLDKSR